MKKILITCTLLAMMAGCASPKKSCESYSVKELRQPDGEVIMRTGLWCIEYYKEHRCCPPLFFGDFANKKTEVTDNIYDNPRVNGRR